jgi:hypothetical protein
LLRTPTLPAQRAGQSRQPARGYHSTVTRLGHHLSISREASSGHVRRPSIERKHSDAPDQKDLGPPEQQNDLTMLMHPTFGKGLGTVRMALFWLQGGSHTR